MGNEDGRIEVRVHNTGISYSSECASPHKHASGQRLQMQRSSETVAALKYIAATRERSRR